jgi:hypothetical protein
MIAIFILSEQPGGDGGPLDLLPEFLSNPLHVPLFAGLAWCLLMSLSGGQWNETISGPLYMLIGGFAGAYAALDEWHQLFMPGRFAGVGDFLLDCVGIAALLLVHCGRRNSVVAS